MKEKIRVLHLVESLDVGGMENGLVNLANHFDYNRFDLIICCFAKGGKLAARLHREKAKLIELNYGPGFHLEAVFPLVRLLKLHRVHILHTHGWGARSLIGLLSARLAGVPICANGEHGQLHIVKKKQLLMQRIMAHMFDDTLSVSEGLKQKIVAKLGLEKMNITVIPNGVDAERFNGNYAVEKLRQKLNIGTEEFVIGVVGSLKWQKNQHVVLRAVHKMRKDGSNIKLLLVGNGPDREMLIKLAESLDVAEDILFLGARDDIPELLCVMDVLVLSSIYDFEGLSNVLLEAMASKTPVISTKSVGAKELIVDGKSGLFFHPDRPEDLVNKIAMIKDNSYLRENIIRNAKEKIIQNFTLDVMIKRYQNYYDWIFNKRILGT